MSTLRLEPSIPDLSNLAFSPQSVQYMNLGKEEHWPVIPTALIYYKYSQQARHQEEYFTCKKRELFNEYRLSDLQDEKIWEICFTTM